MAESRKEDRLTLILDWPEITPEKLSTISGLWADLLSEVSKQVAGKAVDKVKQTLKKLRD